MYIILSFVKNNSYNLKFFKKMPLTKEKSKIGYKERRMSGINDGKFQIESGGISHAIAKEVGLNAEQCKKVDWRSVFDIVNEAKGSEGNNVNWGGGSDLGGPYRDNYKVKKGDTFEFSAEIWTRIFNKIKESLTSKNVDVTNLNELAVEAEKTAAKNVEETKAAAKAEKANNVKGTTSAETAQAVIARGGVPEAPEQVAVSPEAKRFAFRRADEEKMTTETIEGVGVKNTSYDSQGRKIKEITVFSATDESQETFYDEAGNITHTLARDKQGAITYAEAFDKDGRSVSTQNEKGEVTLAPGSKTGVKIDRDGSMESYLEYNDKGQVTRATNSFGDVDLYEYDDKGNKIFDAKYINGNLHDKTVYKYDDSVPARELERTRYENEDGSDVETERSVFKYYRLDGDDYDTKEENCYLNGEIERTVWYSLDDKGRVVEWAEDYPTKHDSEFEGSGNYWYDENGNIRCETNDLVEERFNYEYDSYGNKIKSTCSAIYTDEDKYYDQWRRDTNGEWKWMSFNPDGTPYKDEALADNEE